METAFVFGEYFQNIPFLRVVLYFDEHAGRVKIQTTNKKYIYLIRCFNEEYRRICLRVALYFEEPAGGVKIQTTSKNIRRYFTPKHLIRDLLSNLTFFNLFQ